MMKKRLSVFALSLILLAGIFWFYPSTHQPKDYGVFIGMEKKELLELTHSYQTLVLDATYLEKSDINNIQSKAPQIFAYLNVGALETSNSFYPQFQSLRLEPYDNWPDEYWIDVTDLSWQEFLIKNQAKSLKEKGVTGLFLDNFDVYDHDQRPEVYASLLKLLRDLNAMHLPLIINGGSTFVSQLVSENPSLARQLIFAINQENVFLAYDFEVNQAIQQSSDALDFYLDYLETVSQEDIGIFLIEYGANAEQADKILKQCQKWTYKVYLAPNILLDRE